MMSRHVRPDPLGWIENTLPPHERRRFEAHLAACPECRARWEAELAGTAEIAGALKTTPAALQALARASRQARMWQTVWNRVQPGCRRAHAAWQVSLSIGLVALFFAFSSVWPGVVAGAAPSATFGVAATPRVAQLTPAAPPGIAPGGLPAATRSHSTSTIAPLPVATPAP